MMQRIKEFDRKITGIIEDMPEKHPVFDKWVTKVFNWVMIVNICFYVTAAWIIKNYGDKSVQNDLSIMVVCVMGLFNMTWWAFVNGFEKLKGKVRALETKIDDISKGLR